MKKNNDVHILFLFLFYTESQLFRNQGCVRSHPFMCVCDIVSDNTWFQAAFCSRFKLQFQSLMETGRGRLCVCVSSCPSLFSLCPFVRLSSFIHSLWIPQQCPAHLFAHVLWLRSRKTLVEACCAIFRSHVMSCNMPDGSHLRNPQLLKASAVNTWLRFL